MKPILALSAPIARIILRYGVGLLAGMSVGNYLAADPDIVILASSCVAASIEGFYAIAKRKGWAT